jgi:proteasome lid subunit RPN8/RPN11
MAQIASALRAVGVASGPGIEATPSDADTRRMPLDGLDPAEQREIRDAVGRTVNAAGHAVG